MKSRDEIKIAQLTQLLAISRQGYHELCNILNKDNHKGTDWKQCVENTCSEFKKTCANLGIDI